ncbi:hypothetical protein [uncultured Sulfitobacter sp.]|uniref:hypothetical protein n=1 Tax=uncultured Sulfitobacter sp. TaxID=191468 RepID=UPI0030FB70E3
MRFLQKLSVVFLAAVGVLIPVVSANAQTSLLLPYKTTAFETSDAGIREAYGRISYKVDYAVDSEIPNTPPHLPSVESSLKSFLRDSVTRAFGGESGNYVLTLSILSGSREIAKKAILSFSYSEKNFLFFTTDSTITGNLSRSGVLTDNFPITASNNVLNTQLRLQKNSTAFVQTETFNDFSEQVSLLSFETLQPALELLPSMQTALGVMSKVVNSNEDVDISNDVAMRFIDTGTDAPSEIIFSVRGSLNRNEPFLNGIDISVTFETERSLYKEFADNKFESVDFARTLPFAVVGVSSASLSFEDAIGAKQYETLRSYLASLQRGTFPADATPNSVCRELWDTLLEFFTINDAPLVYAAYLRRYDFELNTQGAKRQCVERYAQTFKRLGIPSDQIAIQQ